MTRSSTVVVSLSMIMSAASLILAVTAVIRAPTEAQMERLIQVNLDKREGQRVDKFNEILNIVRRDFALPPREAHTYEDVIEEFLELVESISGDN